MDLKRGFSGINVFKFRNGRLPNSNHDKKFRLKQFVIKTMVVDQKILKNQRFFSFNFWKNGLFKVFR